MENSWVMGIAILIFVLVTFFYWKVTIDFFKKEYGEKRWKLWGQRTFYWQGILYASYGVTLLILFLLKRTSVLTF